MKNPHMEYYKFVYRKSNIWDGKSPLSGKIVIVYCEQGYGDIIQFLRFIPVLAKEKCHIILHCPKSLQTLIEEQNWGIELFDKHNPDIPKHDFHILSMDLPLFFETSNNPYLKINSNTPIDNSIGVCWESGFSKEGRDFNLKEFKGFDQKLFMLFPEIKKQEFFDDSIVIYQTEMKDFLDTAKLINSVDAVISVDTAVLHLAGAMGKNTYAILQKEPDERWVGGSKSIWYPSIRMFKGKIKDSLKSIKILLDVKKQLN